MGATLKHIFCMVAMVVFLSGCASAPLEDRLAVVEMQVQDQKILDMRIAHLEQKMQKVEEELGSLQASGNQAKNPSKKDLRAQPVAAKQSDTTPTQPVKTAVQTTPTKIEPAKDTKPTSAIVPALDGAAPASSTPVEPASVVSPPVQSVEAKSTPESSKNEKEASATSVEKAPQKQADAGVEDMNLGSSSDALKNVENAMKVANTSPSISKDDEKRHAEQKNSTSKVDVATSQKPVAVAAKVDDNKSSGSAAAYKNALAAYNAKRYTEAEQAFGKFLVDYPKDTLAPNAKYWSGESLYARGDFPGAIIAFKQLVSEVPQHLKAVDALLKIGMSYAHIGDMENAKFYLDILVEDFPDSNAAKLARKRLESIPK